MGRRNVSGRRARGPIATSLRVAPLAVPLGTILLGACGDGGGTRYEAESPSIPATQAGSAPGSPFDAATEDITPPAARVPIGQAALDGQVQAPERPVGGTPTRPPVTNVAPGDLPSQLQQFQDDPNRLEPLPEAARVEVLADTGLQVVYTTDAQLAAVSPLWVEAQWQSMQTCTGVVAPPPLVLIVEGEARPLTPEDDVVLDIDGIALASASTDAAGTTLQVVDSDLAPGNAGRGFALRAIMGRWLWQGASLPERDYPFACADEEASPGT